MLKKKKKRKQKMLNIMSIRDIQVQIHRNTTLYSVGYGLNACTLAKFRCFKF